jgi:hypothetical protein
VFVFSRGGSGGGSRTNCSPDLERRREFHSLVGRLLCNLLQVRNPSMLLVASSPTYMSGTTIRGTLKTPKSQLVTPISTKLQRPDGCD